MKNILLSASILLGISGAFAMDENGWASTYESLSAFEKINDREGYVKPLINNLGNVLNSNWYVSASVPQSLAIEFGLPISLIFIGNDDKHYTQTDTDPYMGSFSYETPTIFGNHRDMSPESEDPIGLVYGNKTLNGLGVFTYPYLQAGASFYHARVVLRGMVLPAVSELRKFNLLGFGLQYSFGHFFQYMLPPAAQPLDVSLVFGYSNSTIGYQPDEFDGELGLDISTTNFSVVIGYKPFSFFEVLMTLGYQSAEMKSYGHLVGNAKLYGQPDYTRDYGKEICPDLTVQGNNGFRFGLEVAFQLGKTYHPVVGFDYAGKTSFTLNALYLRQQFGEDKTPDEIAKEKGYVRGGNNAESSNDSAVEENSAALDAEESVEETAEPEAEPIEDTATEEAAEPADEAPANETADSSESDFDNLDY